MTISTFHSSPPSLRISAVLLISIAEADFLPPRWIFDNVGESMLTGIILYLGIYLFYPYRMLQPINRLCPRSSF